MRVEGVKIIDAAGFMFTDQISELEPDNKGLYVEFINAKAELFAVALGEFGQIVEIQYGGLLSSPEELAEVMAMTRGNALLLVAMDDGAEAELMLVEEGRVLRSDLNDVLRGILGYVKYEVHGLNGVTL